MRGGEGGGVIIIIIIIAKEWEKGLLRGLRRLGNFVAKVESSCDTNSTL